MLKKLHAIKNIEEVLGIAGLGYLALLAVIAGVLIKFLVGTLADSLGVEKAVRPVPATFNLELFRSLQAAGAPLATPAVITAATTTVTTTTTTTTATTTPAQPDLAAASLRILNGTSRTGLAKLWQDRFEAAGFGTLTIGNAATKRSGGAAVTYKPSASGTLPTVRRVLESNGVASTTEQEGTEASAYDFVIVVGQ